MDLLWPASLALLGLIPLLIVAYVLAQRRRRRAALRFSSLALVREAAPSSSRLRRHLPFVVFLIALASLVLALSRPAAIVSIPTNQITIVLVIDVSRSMRQADILPTRLDAAKAAALSFVQRQASTTQIGLVAFAGFAELIQAPTTDQEALDTAIQSLTTGRRTAIGGGILMAIDAIAEIDPNVARSITVLNPGPAPAPVPKGAYAPEIIVLLTDGVSNAGPLPIDAAQQAADRGVRVYTIGFGTAQGAPLDNGGFQFGGGGQFQGGGQFGFGQGGGGGFRRGIDEDTLKQVAALTGGAYYPAASADELLSVFQNLPTSLITRHDIVELSVVFTMLGGLLIALAVGLALLWHPLP